MQITVRSSHHGTVSVEVNPGDLIADLIQKLEEIWHISLDSQKYEMIYSGKPLLSEKTVDDYRIAGGATVDLRIINQNEGSLVSQLRISLVDGERTIDLWIFDDFTGRQVRVSVANMLDLNVDEIKIFYLRDNSARLFGDRDELDFLEIHRGASFFVKRLSKQPYPVIVELEDSSKVTVAVTDFESIGDIRAKVAHQSGISSEFILITFNGVSLEYYTRLSDTLITSGSNLRATSSTVEISFFDTDLRKQSLKVSPSSLVKYVKKGIAAALGVSGDNRNLFHDNEVLDDDLRLENYNIIEEATLSLGQQRHRSITLEGDDGLLVPHVIFDVLKPIIQVKEELAGRYFMVPKSPDHFDLVLDGHILQNDRNLSSYKIIENQKIHIRRRWRERGFDKIAENQKIFNDWQSMETDIPDEMRPSNKAIQDHYPLPLRPIPQGPTLKTAHMIQDRHYHQKFQSDAVETKDSKPSTQNHIHHSQVTIPTATTPMDEPLSLSQSFQENTAHILDQYAADLSRGKWKLIREQISEPMKWDIEYENDCWTYSPTVTLPADNIPLTIAGAPVVIPVNWQYPLVAGVAPPPDPYPTPINPKDPLSMKTIVAIFEEFPDALGFYMLINGFLQIIVPKKFDYEWAFSYQPNRFGRLKVSYIKQTMTGTAWRTPRQQPAPTNIRQGQNVGITRSNRAASPTATGPLPRTIPDHGTRGSGVVSRRDSFLTIRHLIEARKIGSKSTLKHQGRIGLKVRHRERGNEYLTMSTHVATNALLARDSQSFFQKWRPLSGLPDVWEDDVDIFVHGTKFGYISETFDPDAQEFPTSFNYDTSLVKPYNERDITDVKAPIRGMHWASKECWDNMTRGVSGLRMFHEQVREMKSIRADNESRYRIVGTGILKKKIASVRQTSTRRGMGDLSSEDLKKWASLVAKSLLYRVNPDFESPLGQSGAAIYTEETRDGVVVPAVLGFQSFFQDSGRSVWELESDNLESRLEMGSVSFYGAFKAPRFLREAFEIV